MFIQKGKSRKVMSAEDIDVEVDVAPEATDLLFEAEDVAELIAEVTDEVVEVNVDGDDVVFNVGEEEFVVTPDGDEEILESSRRVLKGKKPISSGRKIMRKQPVKSSTRTIRKISK